MSTPDHAQSFAGVADAYDRARPSYPREAAVWLTGATAEPPLQVLELGAGTGLLTEQVAALGHRVIATDPLGPMLAHLARRQPRVEAAIACAEQIPVRSQRFDVVVSAQAFHWFDTERALPEIARVLRPGGHVGLVWNLRDERIPWVRRLGSIIGTQEQDDEPTGAIATSQLFGLVERETFRHWQPLDRPRLHDLVVSRSNVAVMDDAERAGVLREVDALYDEYGRGPDGMLLPYVTHCYRAVVRPRPEPARTEAEGRATPGGDDDPDTLLIDFS